jgi:hypothetical protein
MIKRTNFLTIVVPPLPLVAFSGGSVDVANSSGTLSDRSTGVTLSGSKLLAVNGFDCRKVITGNDVGTLDFSARILSGGSLQMRGTITAGSVFNTSGNGIRGIPVDVILNGSVESLAWEVMLDPSVPRQAAPISRWPAIAARARRRFGKRARKEMTYAEFRANGWRM